jgi:hypothetical protein
MTHANDFPPRDFGVSCLSFGLNVPRGFSKYLYQMGKR